MLYYKDIQLKKKRKEEKVYIKGKVNKYLIRAAKALVISEPIIE